MTYGEATEFVTEFLRGDKSNPTVSPIHYKMAIMEVATLCIPSTLKAEYDGTQTDVFRLLHVETVETSDYKTKDIQYYIQTPNVPQTLVDTDVMPIDEQLSLAVIFYICSYLSNKYTDRFEAKAKQTISIYVSNEL